MFDLQNSGQIGPIGVIIVAFQAGVNIGGSIHKIRNGSITLYGCQRRWLRFDELRIESSGNKNISVLYFFNKGFNNSLAQT